MFSSQPVREPLPGDDAALDALLDALPESAVVFLLELGEGQQPYLGRCGNLRRRAKRMLRPATGTSRLLNLRGIAKEIAWWPAGSSLEGSIVLLEQARARFPERYRRMLRLRFPSFVRLLTANRFPRLVVTSQPADATACFGPFLFRTQAEDFLSRALDHFLLRHCDEDLSPSPSHPGCIYGEMQLCLRPCQAAVPDERYQEEARAFLTFLGTEGQSLRAALEAERDAASEALDFEGAARLHKRLGKLDECWRGVGDFAGILAHLHGVAIAPGAADATLQLWPVAAGRLQPPLSLSVEDLQSGELAARLRGALSAEQRDFGETERECLAVLTKWRHSSWCDGEWVRIGDPAAIPARRIVNAARRVLARMSGPTAPPGSPGSFFPSTGRGAGERTDDREDVSTAKRSAEAPLLPADDG